MATNAFYTNCVYYGTMLVKEQVQSVVAPRPNSFAGLMEMYEINYIQLRLLLGDLHLPVGQYLACVPGHIPVKIDVKENSRHTTILMMTYQFSRGEDGAEPESRPDILVRISHDALQAEVVKHDCRLLAWQRNQAASDSMLHCRWRMNRFLFKWVSYLRNKAYRFEKYTPV